MPLNMVIQMDALRPFPVISSNYPVTRRLQESERALAARKKQSQGSLILQEGQQRAIVTQGSYFKRHLISSSAAIFNRVL